MVKIIICMDEDLFSNIVNDLDAIREILDEKKQVEINIESIEKGARN